MDFPRGFPLPSRASRGGGVAESGKSVDVSRNTSRWFTLTPIYIMTLSIIIIKIGVTTLSIMTPNANAFWQYVEGHN
jgi:hypothetical protein